MGRTFASQSVKAYPFRTIENFPNKITDDFSAVDAEGKFRERMTNLGIDDIMTEILTLRYVFDMSLRDITTELHIPSVSTTLNLLNRALKILKEMLSE